MLMMMNGFNTNFDAEGNQVYAVNTVAFHYINEPIQVKRGELVRIYLVNILEYDPINSFHIHANFFDYFPTGTRLEPTEFTDTSSRARPSAGSASCASRTRASSCSTPTRPSSPSSAGWASSRSRLMEAAERDRRTDAAGPLGPPAWVLGGRPAGPDRRARSPPSPPSAAPGSASAVGPPIEELAVERTVLRPGEIELTVRNTGPDPVDDRPGLRRRRLRRLRGDRPRASAGSSGRR